MPRDHPISKFPNEIWVSLSSDKDIVNEYTNVPMIAEQLPCNTLNEKIIVNKTL